MAAIIFAKRQELCKYLTQLVFTQSTDKTLIDYNFNVETIVSSDSFARVNEQLLNIELVLKCHDQLERVTIEMNLTEASDFLQRL